MVKVITYGTYDLLHYGHIKLLERAKALGDYLIVGVTADGFDRARGKINVQQSLMERIEAVRATGIPDEIIIEEYEGQKIDDICRMNVDIFTVGSDWEGKFDYLNEYCKVIYLPRTDGVSSSKIRAEENQVKVGLIGDSLFLNKVESESHFVNGISVIGVATSNVDALSDSIKRLPVFTEYKALLESVDAVYIKARPEKHYEIVKDALLNCKHVLCESPLALNEVEWEELVQLSEHNDVVLMDGIKTAYSTAFSRLCLLVKSGLIGKVKCVEATCTSLRNVEDDNKGSWDAMFEWGPTALLPIFQILGTKYKHKYVYTYFYDKGKKHDAFTKVDFIYPNAVASVKIGNGVKSEGALIISGTKGYLYVPAPWWNTDYFEIRYENQDNNKRYYYQLDGEGIRYELLCFLQAINKKTSHHYVARDISKAITKVIGELYRKEHVLDI